MGAAATGEVVSLESSAGQRRVIALPYADLPMDGASVAPPGPPGASVAARRGARLTTLGDMTTIHDAEQPADQ